MTGELLISGIQKILHILSKIWHVMIGLSLIIVEQREKFRIDESSLSS